MKKTRHREKVWKQSLFNAIHSRLVGLVSVSIVVLILILHFKARFPLVRVILVVPLLLGIAWYKFIAFEGLLVFHSVFNTFGLFDWYNKVDDNLYLGAIVINNIIFTQLTKGVGVNAVVSVVESFELETSILLGSIITADDWKAIEVDQIQLSCRDFQPPPFSVLDKGADYINSRIVNNDIVYVHCKSGRGRSASVVMAYFMKYRGLNAQAAYKKLKLARSEVFAANSKQMKNISEYEVYLRTGIRR